MCVGRDVVKVVMLCQCQEMKKGVMRDACFPYWPNEMSEAQWRGNLQIKLIDIQVDRIGHNKPGLA